MNKILLPHLVWILLPVDRVTNEAWQVPQQLPVSTALLDGKRNTCTKFHAFTLNLTAYICFS